MPPNDPLAQSTPGPADNRYQARTANSLGAVSINSYITPAPEPKGHKYNWRHRKAWIALFSVLLVSASIAAAILVNNHAGPAAKSVSGTTPSAKKQTAAGSTKVSTVPQSVKSSSKSTAPSQNEQKVSQPPTTSPSPAYTISDNSPVDEYGTEFYYAGASQGLTGAKGVSVNIAQANPSVPVIPGKEDHSLIELAAAVKTGYNYIEIGWTVDPLQFGDSKTHLFISRWIGTANQCYISGANPCGFVQVSSNNTPGEAISSSGTGSYKVNLVGSNWYVYYNSDAIGYFPASLWGSGANSLTTVQVFGEVEIQLNTTKCVPMGNGVSGKSSLSSRISGYALIGSSDKSAFSSFYQTSSNMYYLGSPAATGFNVGGPGRC